VNRSLVSRLLLSSLLVAAALCLPEVALADPGEALLQEGLVNYRVGKFDAALKVLDRAARKGKDPKVLGRVHLYRGLVLGVMGKGDKAKAAFTDALRSDPLLLPKEGEAKSSVLALFNGVRDGLKGTLKVTADRPGAQVTVGGKVLGPAPYTGELCVGAHKVVVATPDAMYSASSDQVIKAGDTATVNAALVFVGSRLSISSNPAGAKIIVDGKEVGAAPLKDHLLLPGEHKLELGLDGHQPVSRDFATRKGETLSLDLELRKADGAVAQPDPDATPKPQPAGGEPVDDKGGFHWPVYTSIAAGVALAALGAGIGLGVASNSAYEELKEEKNDATRWEELNDEVKSLELGSNISFGVAGGAAVAAVLLYIFVDRPAAKAKDEQTAQVLWGPTGASIRLIF